MLLTLLSSPDCDGYTHEQGFPRLWEIAPQLTINGLDKQFAAAPFDLGWCGLYFGHRLRDLGPTETLDSLVPQTANEAWVEKTPMMHWPAGWPEDYIRQSERFDWCDVICCYRSPWQIYQSARAKWGLMPDGFFRAYDRFYGEAPRHSTIIVPYLAMRRDPIGVAREICERLGICIGEPIPWIPSSRD
jgi:hypothetical protein